MERERRNEQLMRLIRAVHSVVGSEDIGKNRISQEQMARKLGHSRDIPIQNLRSMVFRPSGVV